MGTGDRSNSAADHRSITRELVPTGFYRANKKARVFLDDKGKASSLLNNAIAKAARSKTSLGDVWDDLLTLFRLLRNWITGGYRDVSVNTMLLVVTAVLYFVMPLDVIPDFVPALGFMDDVAMILFVLNSIRAEFDKFANWEQANKG